MQNDKFTIVDDNGKITEFYKLIKFSSNKTNKTYLIYTDNNKLNIYSSIIYEEDGNIKFKNLEDDIDKKEVEKAIIKFNLEL